MADDDPGYIVFQMSDLRLFCPICLHSQKLVRMSWSGRYQHHYCKHTVNGGCGSYMKGELTVALLGLVPGLLGQS